MHNAWLTKTALLAEPRRPEHQQALRLLRNFNEAHGSPLSAELIDFLYYDVSDGFFNVSLRRNLAHFFRFIGYGGLDDLLGRNCQMVHMDALHDKILQQTLPLKDSSSLE